MNHPSIKGAGNSKHERGGGVYQAWNIIKIYIFLKAAEEGGRALPMLQKTIWAVWCALTCLLLYKFAIGFSEGKIEFYLSKVQQTLLDGSPSSPSSHSTSVPHAGSMQKLVWMSNVSFKALSSRYYAYASVTVYHYYYYYYYYGYLL